MLNSFVWSSRKTNWSFKLWEFSSHVFVPDLPGICIDIFFWFGLFVFGADIMHGPVELEIRSLGAFSHFKVINRIIFHGIRSLNMRNWVSCSFWKVKFMAASWDANNVSQLRQLSFGIVEVLPALSSTEPPLLKEDYLIMIWVGYCVVNVVEF